MTYFRRDTAGRRSTCDNLRIHTDCCLQACASTGHAVWVGHQAVVPESVAIAGIRWLVVHVPRVLGNLLEGYGSDEEEEKQVRCCSALTLLLCSAWRCFALQCFAMQCFAVLCRGLQCFAVLCFAFQVCFALQCFVCFAL